MPLRMIHCNTFILIWKIENSVFVSINKKVILKISYQAEPRALFLEQFYVILYICLFFCFSCKYKDDMWKDTIYQHNTCIESYEDLCKGAVRSELSFSWEETCRIPEIFIINP